MRGAAAAAGGIAMGSYFARSSQRCVEFAPKWTDSLLASAPHPSKAHPCSVVHKSVIAALLHAAHAHMTPATQQREPPPSRELQFIARAPPPPPLPSLLVAPLLIRQVERWPRAAAVDS